MKRILLIIAVAGVVACGNGSGRADDSDTTTNSSTPPANSDTNPIGIMMGDTTIGINDSLKQ